jgi:putative nucleotidyltransferase with HDIG domain
MKKVNLEKLISGLQEGGFLAWTKNVYEIDGAQVYLVGGAVRDALLGKKDIKDFDFVVRGVSMDRLGEILGKIGKVDLVGKNFGVYKFLPEGKKLEVAYDIALPRKEISLATGGYRDFKVDFDEKLSIKDDLGRRDFTINAMAYEIRDNVLVDEFGGENDMHDKKIRTVGNPYERFEEDYSRMLRGIRFACQLNWNFHDGTRHALKDLMSHLNDSIGDDRIVPYEVIASEMLKSFVASPYRAFDLYDVMGGFKELAPEILKMKDCPQPPNWHSEGDVWTHTRIVLKNLSEKRFKERFSESLIFEKKLSVINAELVMAALWHDVGKPYTIQTPERDGTDRIRFSSHDDEGAKVARSFFERIRFSSVPEFDFNASRTGWLIAKHHLFDTKTISEMKNSTIEKYFFSENYSGEDLLKLGYLDMSASLRPNGEPDLSNFDLMLERINHLKSLGKGKRLPRALLSGDEVMDELKIDSGSKVGLILTDLREMQLSGKLNSKDEAIKYIKSL